MQDDTFLECARCGQVKPVDAFPFARTAPGSSRRDTECKDCINARARDYYAAGTPRIVRLKDAISLARAKYGYAEKRTPREYNARKARDQAKYWKKMYADPEFREKKLAADKARRQRIRDDPVLFEQYRQHKNELRRRWVADLKENHPEKWREVQAKRRQYYTDMRENRPEEYAAYLAKRREQYRARKEASNAR